MTSNDLGFKIVYIVRHAKSSWDYPHLPDFDRPLNKRGKRDVPEMGARLKALKVLPDYIISSPAKRAIATAKGIAKAIGFSKEIEEDSNLYHASVSELIFKLQSLDNKHNSVMLFGHNPGLTYLINEISVFNLDNLPTCAVCALRFEAYQWSDIGQKKGIKVIYDYPKSRKF